MEFDPRKRYHAAILNAFDQNQICTIKNIEDYLKKVNQYQSYASTRRALKTLEKQKLIVKLPPSRQSNAILYTKNVFKNQIVITKHDGSVATLRGYIDYVLSYQNPVISKDASEAIKLWILESLTAPVAEAYKVKNRPVPNAENHRAKLQGTLKMLSELHALIKTFLDSAAWTDVGSQQLIEEFTVNCIEELTTIVDRTWLRHDDEKD